MTLTSAIRAGRWSTVAGALLFVTLLAAGYYYNITFVQLGLIDLGTRVVGLSSAAVSAWMAALALSTFVVAVGVGVAMDRWGVSTDLRAKLRLLLGVVTVQFALTLAAPAIRTEAVFGAWILAASVALGVGFPVSFSLAIDFVPVPDRGYVAAAITAVAYFAANAVPLAWSIDVFSRVMVAAMLPGLVVLAALTSGRVPALESFLDDVSDQYREFGVGRYCRDRPVRTRSLAFWAPVALMFGVFFIDSLGFLRIIETPVLLLASWQSPSLGTRLAIAVVHAVGALMAGVLYVNFDRAWLFTWVFALFAFTYALYTSDLRLAAWFPALSQSATSIVNPLFYSLTVSFYTTLNFALWPDLSTPETVGTHTAVGVGMAGWLATFLSTAVALYLRSESVTLLSHLNLVNALALGLFFALVVALYLRRLLAYRRAVVSS